MSESFDRLVHLMATLRAPEGCPWDRKQTHESLKPYLIEEAYEVLETIDHKDARKLREELGDLLLQVLFHAQIGTEEGTFTITEVLDQLADKLVRRHPHVFAKQEQPGDTLSPDQVYSNWEQIKRDERARAGQAESALHGVPKTLPSLLRAFQVQARASRVGFDWPHTREGTERVIEKIEEEVRELREALADETDDKADRVESEFGDLFFALVNLARFVKVNPEEALRGTTNRFVARFQLMEAAAARAGRPLDRMTLDELDRLWNDAKRVLASSSDDADAGLDTPQT
ncbi:MAG: nucleoside triphosphate pyrophosphohydrolase [Nitrospirota bacterium]|nr:nucleoside triphosphate pyrophosphohydrolase [Nitrospirota bacterium]MDE3242645.1 nucleoside triphosphate pyrophosphohydrolase [Nitrospirota bacterium]